MKRISPSDARLVISLGDAFDDRNAAGLVGVHRLLLARMMAGRRWIVIAGNHDPGLVMPGFEHRDKIRIGPFILRQVAQAGARAKISGHYHPKFRLAGRAMWCFPVDGRGSSCRPMAPAPAGWTVATGCWPG